MEQYEHLVFMGHLPLLLPMRATGFSVLGKLKGSLADLFIMSIRDTVERSRARSGLICDFTAPLFHEVSPHQRLTLLSEVCLGLLDPNAPLPPDTPEHHSTFVHIIDYWLNNLIVEIETADDMLITSGYLPKNNNKKQTKGKEKKNNTNNVSATVTSSVVLGAFESKETESLSTPAVRNPDIETNKGELGEKNWANSKGSTSVEASSEKLEKLAITESTSIEANTGKLGKAVSMSSACAESISTTIHLTEASARDRGISAEESTPVTSKSKSPSDPPSAPLDNDADNRFQDSALRNLMDRRHRHNVKKKLQDIDENEETRQPEADDPMSMLCKMVPFRQIWRIVNNIEDACLGEDGTEGNRKSKDDGDDDSCEDDDESDDGSWFFMWRRAYSAFMREWRPFFALDENDDRLKVWEARHRMVMGDLLPLDDDEWSLLYGPLNYGLAERSHKELMRFSKMSRLVEETVAEYNSEWTRQTTFWAERSLDVVCFPKPGRRGLCDSLRPEKAAETKKRREYFRKLFRRYPGKRSPESNECRLGPLICHARTIWMADWHEHMARAGRQYDSITDRLDALREMHSEAEAAEAAAKASMNRENGTGTASDSLAPGSDRVAVTDGGGAPCSGTRLLLHAPPWAEVTHSNYPYRF